MNPFAACLFFLGVLGALGRRWNISEGWPLVFWMLPFSWLIAGPASGRVFWALIWFCLGAMLFFQDLKTLHFGKWWLPGLLFFPAASFLEKQSQLSRWMGLVFPVGALVFMRAGMMGSADVLFMLGAGWLLGAQRMIVCLLLACLSGLLWAACFRQKTVPFLCFLSWSFCICWGWGWQLCACLFRFLSELLF